MCIRDRWQDRLYGVARRITHRDDAAQDVVQEAWANMVSKLDQLDDPKRFRAWAYRIVTNKANDWLRKQQRQKSVVDGLDDVSVAADADDGPRDLAEHADEIKLLLKMIYRLPLDQRALLTMAYEDQLQLSEIAQRLDVPVGTVKSRLHKARQDLKALIEGQG